MVEVRLGESEFSCVDACRLLQIVTDGGHCRKTGGVAFICANLETVFSFKHAPIISHGCLLLYVMVVHDPYYVTFCIRVLRLVLLFQT